PGGRHEHEGLFEVFSGGAPEPNQRDIRKGSAGFRQHDEGVFLQPRRPGGPPPMMAQTSTGLPMEPHVLGNYLRALVNQFFKILPMWESGEKTVGTYIRSLQCELLGCRELV